MMLYAHGAMSGGTSCQFIFVLFMLKHVLSDGEKLFLYFCVLSIILIILILVNTSGYLGKTSVFSIQIFYIFNWFLIEETIESGEMVQVVSSVICLTAFLDPMIIFSGTEGKHPMKPSHVHSHLLSVNWRLLPLGSLDYEKTQL